ncbi:uncharacterized protein LOC110902083 [Helianthus annuus]|uniref:uncharacterized protein LOC110902083 n=1 Tax=Helianthus annuus TaxID=4232 RepID=UPI000B907A86|nr:uncharacterized protein LOC110902083 [Helianthus annuus]
MANVIRGGIWQWLEAWRDTFPILFQLNPISLVTNKQDVTLWKDSSGNLKPPTSKMVWESVRSRGQEVAWSLVVWSSFNIPKHSFHSWLIFRRKLWTQDRIRSWNCKVTGSMNMMCCMLCNKGMDSHEHLFFECEYSLIIVWTSIKSKSSMKEIQGSWEDIMAWMIPRSKSRSLNAVIAKLIVKVAAYFIWQERNARFFNNQLRPPEQITNIIENIVRLKLQSFKYKDTTHVRRIMEEWKLDTRNTFKEN